MGLRSKSLFASFWFLSEICVFLAVLALSLLASFQLVVVWVCLRVFGLLRSFGFFDKFWLWFVLAFFTIKNEVFFLGFDFGDVICANFRYICNQGVKICRYTKFQNDRIYLTFGSLS